MHLLLRHKPRFLADIKNRLVKPPNSGEKKKKKHCKNIPDFEEKYTDDMEP